MGIINRIFVISMLSIKIVLAVTVVAAYETNNNLDTNRYCIPRTDYINAKVQSEVTQYCREVPQFKCNVDPWNAYCRWSYNDDSLVPNDQDIETFSEVYLRDEL